MIPTTSHIKETAAAYYINIALDLVILALLVHNIITRKV